MCNQSPRMQEEFSTMLDGLAAQVGIPNLLRSVEENQWYRACDALKKAQAYHWFTKEGSPIDWRNRDVRHPGEVTLIVDGREFPLAHDLKDDNPHLQAIKDLLEMYAATHAVKGEPETSWRSYRDLAASRKPRTERKPAPEGALAKKRVGLRSELTAADMDESLDDDGPHHGM
jgi:hypothetical protein